MRIVRKVWPARLLATLIALALLASYPIGAYVHAVVHPAGHHPAGHHVAAHHVAAQQAIDVAGSEDAGSPSGHDAQHHASTATGACQHGVAGGGADDDGAGHSRDCCDSVCHGGHAVVADAPPVPHVPPGHPAIEPVAAIDGAKPGGHYRPPIDRRSV